MLSIIRIRSDESSRINEKIKLQQTYEAIGLNEDIIRKSENLNQIFLAQKDVIQTITRLSEQSLNLKTFSFDFETEEPVVTKGYPFLPFILTAESTVENINRIITQIYQSFSLIEIVSIDLTPTSSFSSDTKMVLKGNFYVNENYYQ